VTAGDEGGRSEAVRAYFSRHAADYARSESHRGGRDLDMLAGAAEPLAGAEVLDAATGTGFTAVALARRGARVTAADITPAMLAETARLAERAGVAVRLLLADVARLPVPQASFDRVVSRRAAHHFPDVEAALAEWRRVVRPGGTVVVADMSPPPAAAALLNAMERARDASHRWALTPDQWRTALLAAGYDGVAVATWSERLTLGRWLYPVADEAARRAAEELLAGAAPGEALALGLRREADGEWSFVKQRVVARARRR
jgi:ubiquinone/menaquinone biosynthesis C-methylase UbiE